MVQESHHWKNILISMDTTIISAIKKMDREAQRVLLVVDVNQCLLGIITDGDIRRYLLKQASLEETVDKVMNKNPISGFLSDDQDQLLMKMHSLNLLHLPIVDDDNRVIGLQTSFDNFFTKNTHDNWVIFMAGGMGKRLHPLTLECPKPLLKIGNKPISELLLENFIKNGFKNYIFSINYKSEMIRDYYGSGEKWGVNIKYIQEDDELGTAGSLSLLQSKPDKPFFVVNADVITNVNFGHILDFHRENKFKVQATVCVRQYVNQIPFGLVHINEADHRLTDIEEKPTKSYFVNAGIYILEPEVLQQISYNSYCDMPSLLTDLVKKGSHVTTFPIREYWLDIGHHDALVKATSDYLDSRF